ncbi:zinc-dependent peptidase [Flavisolibacter sp. BT320]|nr:zinc-dependent peptidase [Flavisolibacter longurius]
MSFALVYISAFVVYWAVDYYAGKHRQMLTFLRACQPPDVATTDIVVLGRDLDMEDRELHEMLVKRFHYYHALNEANKALFRKRLHCFIRTKTFLIKDDEGFREMPVLLCAAAVQLGFGLKAYTLPFYRYIRIYPGEFVSHDFLRILAGNVSQNTISVAWNHLLRGYQHALDGSNVGLHEMSHALYFQKMEVEKNYAKSFAKRFRQLEAVCEKAAKTELSGAVNLYSAYADKNSQEFWAETVELFFERPQYLQASYPDVYAAAVQLLQQDPQQKQDPVLPAKIPMRLLRLQRKYKIRL